MGIKNELAGKRNIIYNGPLGPLSHKEIIKWLNYIPNFQKERLNYLSRKNINELSKDEIKELNYYSKELKIASISQIYGKEEIDRIDALEFIDFTKPEKIDKLIKMKLTPEEYNNAKEKAIQLASTLSYDELCNYCREKKKKYDELSMSDSFTLREVVKVVNNKSSKITKAKLLSMFEENEELTKEEPNRLKKKKEVK